ncbi:MAG: MafI family immunity protein [Sphingobacterium sp.]|jgi:hypothetical protein|nr:MafI family immunity protein [Sphingobacterium sp.]
MIAKYILVLLDTAKFLGLCEADYNNAKSFLDEREFGLAFDAAITQLYEYEIMIDQDFYNLIEGIAKRMAISEDGYSFMKELVSAENKLPKQVKDKLVATLKSLKFD